MKIPDFSQLAKALENPVHLVVWVKATGFEVVALAGKRFQDAFPLPMTVQAAAAEIGIILDTSTAARLEIVSMPGDFWEGLEEVDCGERLKVSFLGRSGQKYLEIFHAVESGQEIDESSLDRLALTDGDLLKVARWMREKSLFDHRRGDLMMNILNQLR